MTTDAREATQTGPIPERPALAPGVRVVRRGDSVLQIGIRAEARVLAPDTTEVRQLLEGLERGRLPALVTADARTCWDALLRRGLVVDHRRLREGLTRHADRQAEVAAAYAVHGTDADRRLGVRASARVHLDGPRGLVGPVADLLAQAGLTPSEGRSSGGDGLVVLASDTEVDRARVDEPLRRGQPHLLFASVEGRARVGPFVVPGVTACLRCLDAAAGERDPRHALVVAQYAGAEAPPGGVPHPLDPLQVAPAAALAAGDVVRFVDGDRPLTWSATVTISSDGRIEPEPAPRHPRCGCSWQAAHSA